MLFRMRRRRKAFVNLFCKVGSACMSFPTEEMSGSFNRVVLARIGVLRTQSHGPKSAHGLVIVLVVIPARIRRLRQRLDKTVNLCQDLLLLDQLWSSGNLFVFADVHGFTPFSYIDNPIDTPSVQTWSNITSIIQNIKTTYGGELIMMPGDMVSYGGRTTEQIKKQFTFSSKPMSPSNSQYGRCVVPDNILI